MTITEMEETIHSHTVITAETTKISDVPLEIIQETRQVLHTSYYYLRISSCDMNIKVHIYNFLFLS